MSFIYYTMIKSRVRIIASKIKSIATQENKKG